MSNRYKNTVKKMFELAAGRRIVLWVSDELSLYIYDDFYELGINVEYFVSDQVFENKIKDKEVKMYLDLLYEDQKSIFVVAFAFIDHGKIYRMLTDLGYQYKEDFYIGATEGYFQDYDVIDSLLGYNRYYACVGGYELGFGYIGNKSEIDKQYVILTLGGSTTDPTIGNNKSWPEYLYEMLINIRTNILIINGGLAGYAVNQEFLKFIRDGLDLNVNMLITFDGYNDVLKEASYSDYLFLSAYGKKVYDNIQNKGDFAPDTMGLRNVSEIVHGNQKIKGNESEVWTHFHKMIHAVAKEYNISDFGFLQPMIELGNPIITKEAKELNNALCNAVPLHKKKLAKMKNFYNGVLDFVNSKNYMFDLTDIFDNQEDMYYDICHATDEGNWIIADAIFQQIKECIKEGE